MTEHDTIHCPSCKSPRYAVKDSRPQKVGKAQFVRRRRVCATCGFRTFTLEIPESLANIADLADLMEELE